MNESAGDDRGPSIDPHDWLRPDAADSADAADTGAAAAPARPCARVGCALAACATLTADYDDRVMAVGPLSPERTPPSLDLCARHRAALTPPDGWTLIAHDAELRISGSTINE